MKIGTETGSLVNHIYSRATRGQPKAEVGMGATLLSWTDRHAGTIIEVIGDGESAGTIITVQTDTTKLVDGSMMSEHQEYEYTPNPNGWTESFKLTKEGRWQKIQRNPITGRWNKAGSGGVIIGRREEYRDPCF